MEPITKSISKTNHCGLLLSTTKDQNLGVDVEKNLFTGFEPSARQSSPECFLFAPASVQKFALLPFDFPVRLMPSDNSRIGKAIPPEP